MSKEISSKVLTFIKKNNEASIKKMIDEFSVSKQYLHIVITKLLDEKKIIKVGKTPKTIYKLFIETENKIAISTSAENEQFLKDNFLLITEIGEMLYGIEGFSKWCTSRKLPIEKTIDEYVATKKKYNAYFNKDGLINGLEKLNTTKGYDAICLNDIYYLDFYAIERFGKTKLGTLLHFAKQGQNKFLMKILVEEIKNKIHQFVKQQKFDAYIVVPPTIKREVQLMKFMDTHLKLSIPKIKVNKISGIIPIPQKSLNKLEERINNARHSFSIDENRKYKKILMIDDAIGSGATLNQIAEKLIHKKLAKEIVGLAVVGSFKGFDVITDV